MTSTPILFNLPPIFIGVNIGGEYSYFGVIIMNTKPSTQQPIIRFKNVPVITTEQLAHFYGTVVDNIKMNFSRNKTKFIEGKHFFKLTGQDLKDFVGNSKLLTNNLQPSLRGLQISSKARSLILWTERGAARHAKMLDTDHAWDVFERLEDCYFNQAVKAPEKPNLPLGQNNVYLPNKVGRFFVENKTDGTVIIRPADRHTLIRRAQLDVVKRDCKTIIQELELFSKQLEKLDTAMELDTELLPILGKLNWRGI